jgi:hypothetical protein
MVVDVSQGAHRSVIASSFATKSTELTLQVPGGAHRLHTGTLSPASPIEAVGTVGVREHRLRLRLRPNTVVAIRLG